MGEKGGHRSRTYWRSSPLYFGGFGDQSFRDVRDGGCFIPPGWLSGEMECYADARLWMKIRLPTRRMGIILWKAQTNLALTRLRVKQG